MIVEELIKTYDGKPVVDSVSFSLPKGKVTSLIGPNGAGKSTVMGMISRLIARDGGLVEFEGQDLEAPCDFNAEQSHSDEADGGRVGGVWKIPLLRRASYRRR